MSAATRAGGRRDLGGWGMRWHPLLSPGHCWHGPREEPPGDAPIQAQFSALEMRASARGGCMLSGPADQIVSSPLEGCLGGKLWVHLVWGWVPGTSRVMPSGTPHFMALDTTSFTPPSRQHLFNPPPGQHAFTTPRSDKQRSLGSTIHDTSHFLMHTHFRGENFPAPRPLLMNT